MSKGCKVLRFRARISSFPMFASRRIYVESGVRLSLLKRDSCDCCNCNEDLEMLAHQMVECMPLNPNDFKNNQVYRLRRVSELDVVFDETDEP